MKQILSVFRALLLLACAGGLNAAIAAGTAAPQPGDPGVPRVRYDGSTDRVTVEARDASLTGILSRIARLSGLEILIDPAVERSVNLDIEDQPLEQGIRTLTRGLNTVLVHDMRTVPGLGDQNLLVTVKLLPKGQTNTALLVPVLSPEAEAMMRADQRDRNGKVREGLANDRRMARLAKLPPEQRERLERIEQERVQMDLQRSAGRAEQKAERMRVKLDRLNRQLQDQQARPALAHPERKQARILKLQQEIAETQAELNGTVAP